MQPLTEDEAALLYHVQRFGSDGYPIEKVGRGWIVRDWLTVRGPRIVFKTRRAATDQFDAWASLARERLRAMQVAAPGSILTAVGVIVPGAES